MIQQRLKGVTKVPDNGVIIFVGIDFRENEIFEVITPPNPVSHFYYKCDKRFHVDVFEKLFEKRALGHIMFLDGNECMIYQYNGVWKRIKHFDAVIVKRHNKGGFSSNRFARIAEESRIHYITRVVEVVNEVIQDTKSINYVFGGDELKTMFMQSPELKPKFQTESMYHSFTKETIGEQYFTTLMNKVNNGDINKIATELVRCIDMEQEQLLFSIEELIEHSDNVEYCLIVDEKVSHLIKSFPKKVFYTLNIDNPLYGRFKGFSIVAKMYHKLGDNFEELDDVVHELEGFGL